MTLVNRYLDKVSTNNTANIGKLFKTPKLNSNILIK